MVISNAFSLCLSFLCVWLGWCCFFCGVLVFCTLSGAISIVLFVVPLVLFYINILLVLAVKKKPHTKNTSTTETLRQFPPLPSPEIPICCLPLPMRTKSGNPPPVPMVALPPTLVASLCSMWRPWLPLQLMPSWLCMPSCYWSTEKGCCSDIPNSMMYLTIQWRWLWLRISYCR